MCLRVGSLLYSSVMCVCVCVCVCVCLSVCLCVCPVMSDPMGCNLPGSSVHRIFQARIPGVGCHFLLQGIFSTQGSNPHPLCLLHWRADSLSLHHLGSPILLWDKAVIIVGSKVKDNCKCPAFVFYLKLLGCSDLSLMFPLSPLSKCNFQWIKDLAFMNIWENICQSFYPAHYLMREPVWG